ncbi:MAG: NAD-dependent epimerase/dehydratase family protein [Legionellaceae bacterium]|nr:NAD-dependent epimerase/dehydratase family protein [Legionellaceae bacterium]
MKQKIAIIGGAGFIGSHLTEYYLQQGAQVTVVDNLSSGSLDNLSAFDHSNLTFYPEDALVFAGLDRIIMHSDIVYNMAAQVGMFHVLQHPIDTMHTNIDIVNRLLYIMAGLARKPLFVVASSSEVYGAHHSAVAEDDLLRIDSSQKSHAGYYVSKLCNEVMAMSFYKEKQVPVIIIRLFNTIGPRQTGRYGMVVPRFIGQALHHEPLTIHGDGQQIRSFCDVKRVCLLLDAICKNSVSIGEIINVGNDMEISILQLATLIKQLTGSHSTFDFKSYREVYGEDYSVIGYRRPNLDKIRRISGQSCQWGIEETLQAIIHDMKRQAGML